tara:strand:+ start:382 stop:525 length:144 start_codon:yes stop_codon:yes gene_type:complete
MILEILVGLAFIGLCIALLDSYLIRKRLKKMNEDQNNFGKTPNKSKD